MKIITQLENLLISKDKSLKEGLQLLDKNGLQILLIVDEKLKLCGTVTDGDIRRHILDNKSLDSELGDIMNKTFTSVSIENEAESEAILRNAKFNHLPVLNGKGEVEKLVVTFKESTVADIVSNIPVVIMAGGKGTRLSPLTKIIPKPLVPVGDVTMIEKIMENFFNNGFRKFIIIVNHKKELIKSYISEISLPYEITFVDEEDYLGTAGGLKLLTGLVGDGQLILSNCDIIAHMNYQSLLQWHNTHNAMLTILGVQKRVDIPYGVIQVDDLNLVTNIEEKPFFNHVIVSGIYVLNTSVIDRIPENTPYDMDKLINDLFTSHEAVTCYPIEDGWFDMGQFEEYRNLLHHFGVVTG